MAASHTADDTGRRRSSVWRQHPDCSALGVGRNTVAEDCREADGDMEARAMTDKRTQCPIWEIP